MLSALSLGLQMGLTTAMPMPAALVSIERHSQFELDRYTRQIEQDGGWWLEMEDRLLVAAPAMRLSGLLAHERVLEHLGAVRPEDFALQSRACGIDEHAQLPPVASAGRFALVRTPGGVLPIKPPAISEWKLLVPNQTLAKDLNARGLIAGAKRAVDPQIQMRVDALDTQRWFDAMTTLATYDRSSYGTGAYPEIDQARDWLKAEFQLLGMTVTTPTFSFGSGPTSVENVVAKLTGSTYPDELVIIGGHYDSRQTGSNPVNTPGAEDNATGCAGVLEAARVFAQFPPQRSMIFVCFAGEEQGLYGGYAYVQSLVDSAQLDNVKLAVIMDMIGYSGDTDLDVLLETSSTLSTVFTSFQTMAATYVPELRVITTTSWWGSDHVPFIEQNVPSLLTIENDYGSYPHYHKSTDLPANVTRAQEMGGGILKMNIAVLTDAAGFERPILRDGFEN